MSLPRLAQRQIEGEKPPEPQPLFLGGFLWKWLQLWSFQWTGHLLHFWTIFKRNVTISLRHSKTCFPVCNGVYKNAQEIPLYNSHMQSHTVTIYHFLYGIQACSSGLSLDWERSGPKLRFVNFRPVAQRSREPFSWAILQASRCSLSHCCFQRLLLHGRLMGSVMVNKFRLKVVWQS